jgi:rsbT co-antagonist protein RsbR
MTEKIREPKPPPPVRPVGEDTASRLHELAEHLRQNRKPLCEEWARRITEAKLLTAMSKEEIFSQAIIVYDHYVEVLESGNVEALEAYAHNISERIIPRGVEMREVVGIVLLLRDVLTRALFAKYQADFAVLNRVLDAYEPAANQIANTVITGYFDIVRRLQKEQAI